MTFGSRCDFSVELWANWISPRGEWRACDGEGSLNDMKNSWGIGDVEKAQPLGSMIKGHMCIVFTSGRQRSVKEGLGISVRRTD